MFYIHVYNDLKSKSLLDTLNDFVRYFNKFLKFGIQPAVVKRHAKCDSYFSAVSCTNISRGFLRLIDKRSVGQTQGA